MLGRNRQLPGQPFSPWLPFESLFFLPPSFLQCHFGSYHPDRKFHYLGIQAACIERQRDFFGKIMEFRELLCPCLSSTEGQEERWEWQEKLEKQWEQGGVSSLIPTPCSGRFQLGMSLNPTWICGVGSVGSMRFLGSASPLGSMGSVSSVGSMETVGSMGF